MIIWYGSENGHEIPEDKSGHIRNKIAWSDFVADMTSMWDSNDHAPFDCARPAKFTGHPVLDRLHHASEQAPKAARRFSDDVGKYLT